MDTNILSDQPDSPNYFEGGQKCQVLRVFDDL
jgi:hypothetical protein